MASSEAITYQVVILSHHQCADADGQALVCRRFALDSSLLLNAFGHTEKERDFLRMRLVAVPLKSAHSVFALYREDRNENICYSAAIPEKALRENDGGVLRLSAVIPLFLSTQTVIPVPLRRDV